MRLSLLYSTSNLSKKIYNILENKLTKTYTPFNADYLVCIGGDGFLLEMMNKYHSYNKPFYPINGGSVGFLTNKFNENINIEILIKNTTKTKINPLYIAIDTIEEQKHALAFNEATLHRQSSQASNLKLTVNKREVISNLIGDGILVSTPYGSTGYNLSAGGPIMPLSSNLLSITPICPYKPRKWSGALIHNDSEITIEILDHEKRPVKLTTDNTDYFGITKILVSKSNIEVNLLYDFDYNLEDRILEEQFI